jgi:hypothetical protein
MSATVARMKDQRVVFLRKAFDGLVESLDATVQIALSKEAESVPEPVQQAAAKLLERLGSANRLAAGRFAGSPILVASAGEISGAIHKLDLAFVEYRRTAKGDGPTVLNAQLDKIKAVAAGWS